MLPANLLYISLASAVAPECSGPIWPSQGINLFLHSDGEPRCVGLNDQDTPAGDRVYSLTMRVLLNRGGVEWLLRAQWTVRSGDRKHLGIKDVSRGAGFNNWRDADCLTKMDCAGSLEHTVCVLSQFFIQCWEYL